MGRALRMPEAADMSKVRGWRGATHTACVCVVGWAPRRSGWAASLCRSRGRSSRRAWHCSLMGHGRRKCNGRGRRSLIYLACLVCSSSQVHAKYENGVLTLDSE